MGLMFSPGEVLQLAVRIEENGEKFYRTMADRLSDERVRELFSFLAEEEVRHRRFYEEILAGLESFEPPESYPGEYFDYLRSYADHVIFSGEALEKAMKGINDEKSALAFAIAREMDSIMYYQEMRGLVPSSAHEKIEAVIAEERRHFVSLSRMRDTIG